MYLGLHDADCLLIFHNKPLRASQLITVGDFQRQLVHLEQLFVSVQSEAIFMVFKWNHDQFLNVYLGSLYHPHSQQQ